MSFTFENQGTNTYLVYEIGANDELDTMSLGMLTNNSIPGFAAASFTQMDTTKYIKYNVSAKVSVAQLFSGAVNKKRLVGVFSGIVDAMLSAEDYMLDPNCLLLDVNYMFADVSTCETELICLPVMRVQHENRGLEMFFKNILFTTQFDQTENCDHVAKLINYLNGNPSLSLVDFKALLDDLAGAVPVQPKTVPKPAPKEAPPQPAVPPGHKTAPQPATQLPAQPVPVIAPNPPRPPVTKPTQPPVTPAVSASVAKTPQVNAGEKPMSFFYLMQHYNKENAAIYKAQQEAMKAKNAVPIAEKTAAAKTSVRAPAKPAAGFAVPGQQTPGFAIPGQQPVSPAAAARPVNPVSNVPQQPAVKPQPVVKPAPAPQPAPQQVYQPPVQTGTPLNFGETTVLGQKIGETTVLAGGMQERAKADPHLIRVKNNEKIPLNKPVFRIGKEKSYVDYFISDNTAVSRSHANIINRDGEFFVVDTNSTNHTYVNGGMIHSNQETKLSHGTKLRFANEDFEFRMY